MKRERLVLLILADIKDNNPIVESDYNLEQDQFVDLLINMQNDNLIKVQSEDINKEFQITDAGIDYLKKIDDEIDKNILEVLYDNRFKGNVTPAVIRKKIFIRLKEIEIESRLELLHDKKYIKIENKKTEAIKKSATFKFAMPSIPYKEYRISEYGIRFVASDFCEIEKSVNPPITYNINGANIINFGVIHNLNYIEELKMEIPDPEIRKEIEEYFEEIKSTVSEEKISKGKLASVFRKISVKLAEYGLDKVIDKVLSMAYCYAITNIIQ